MNIQCSPIFDQEFIKRQQQPVDYSVVNNEPIHIRQGTIVRDFSEFSGIPVDDVVTSIENFRHMNADEFKKFHGAYDFYEHSKTYIYDLLSVHSNLIGPVNKIHKFLPGIFQVIKDHPGTSFLEFGEIGDMCEIMYKHTGKHITYVDIQSYITDFALWRFKKYNLPIDVIIIPQDDFDLPSTYDIIYHDAVLEHLTPRTQVNYSVKLCNALNKNGLMIMIVDLSGESEDMPMHYNVDIQYVHNTMSNNNMECLYGMYNYASIWKKL